MSIYTRPTYGVSISHRRRASRRGKITWRTPPTSLLPFVVALLDASLLRSVPPLTLVLPPSDPPDAGSRPHSRGFPAPPGNQFPLAVNCPHHRGVPSGKLSRFRRPTRNPSVHVSFASALRHSASLDPPERRFSAVLTRRRATPPSVTRALLQTRLHQRSIGHFFYVHTVLIGY